MIPEGPVATYLSELRRELPFPAPRLIAETREHLLEAVKASLAAGFTQADAERNAVGVYGPVADVVTAVLKEGSPIMSPRVIRWFPPLAVLLCVPTTIFVFVNIIERLAGSDGSAGVFGQTFDTWRTQMNALLVFGPILAVSLMVLTGLRFHGERSIDGVVATLELRMSRATVLAAAFVFIVALTVVAYGLVESYGTWKEFHSQNWSCTTESGRKVCYQGNSLGKI